MIKILFFAETLEEGGAEKVLRNLVNRMDQTRFDITVQTVWPCDAARYLSPGIRYRSTYQAKNKFNQLRYRAEAEAGVLYRLHIRDDYDIECAFLEMGPTKVLAASTNDRAKKLAWVHCDLAGALSDPAAFAAKTAPWYAKYDKIVCVSQRVRESFDKVFQNRFDSTVMYNVIDDEAIRQKSLLPMENGRKKRRLTVLAVGRLSPPKNYPRLLKTHKRLLDERLAHDLWIIGEGPEREKLEACVEELQLRDSVWMPGFRENPYPFMRAADLLVCSSNYEGFSTFVIEGILLGRPILTTECSGMREQLGDSEYGLITENNEEAFFLGMKDMLSDPALRRHFAEKAAERAEMISGEKLTREIEDWLQNL